MTHQQAIDTMAAEGYDREVEDVTAESEQLLTHLDMVWQISQGLIALLTGASMFLTWSRRVVYAPPIRSRQSARDLCRPSFLRPMK